MFDRIQAFPNLALLLGLLADEIEISWAWAWLIIGPSPAVLIDPTFIVALVTLVFAARFKVPGLGSMPSRSEISRSISLSIIDASNQAGVCY